MAAKLCEQQRAEMPRKILREYGKISPLVHHALKKAQRAVPVARKKRIRHIKQEIAFHAAEHAVNILRRNGAPAEGDALIRKGERIAHAALRRAGNGKHPLRRDRRPRAFQHAFHAGRDVRNAQAVKIEPLAAGDDRSRNALRLGRGKNEHNVRRRLFQRFEQRVESVL